MKYGLTVPNFGQFFDPRVVADLAQEAEKAGWDGFFLWDHMLFDGRPRPIADPWVALAAIASHTSRIRIGTLVTPLARRRPWKLARETVSLDHLSGGRLILGVGLGAPSDVEFARFGEDPDPIVRGQKLDEGLEILAGLWTGRPFRFEGRHFQIDEVIFEPPPVQTPRIPIWVGGVWPRKRPFRRAARWDGVFPLIRTKDVMFGSPTPQDLGEIRAYVEAHRASSAPFDTVVGGEFPRAHPQEGARRVEAFAEAGATWWLEGPGGDDDLTYLRELIPQGPPDV
ncbi:MAG: TIGR03619 family F420-dependent LLM class oxidoreductase [Thermoplasmata archaeon]